MSTQRGHFEPHRGDVVRFQNEDYPDDSYTNVYLPRGPHDPEPWMALTHDTGTRYSDEDARADHLDGWTTRLLVSGRTGDVVAPAAAAASDQVDVTECPDCGETGRYDGRVKVGGRGIYACPAGHRWQNLDEVPSTKGYIEVPR